MEALLVAPKLSVFFAVRGHSRRSKCLVAAAGHGKEQGLDTRSDRGNANGVPQALLPSKVLTMARRSLFAAAVIVPLPCHASPLEPSLELYRTVAVLGDLDPATAKTVAGVAGPALSALGFLFILRIVMSWYPRLPVTKFPYVLAYAPTEPFLAVTRKVIPPLGGVDVTPVVWFGLVSFLNEILVGPQGLLVLLSQQQV
ncbi:hypothetical protein EJB05_18960 [Eragrostis curvula]|uniref:Protein COFACTOR ASSEMBLY OF COMPLEX C SUBUNIT B CCB3, chloroplastic n=1 Tax=Eragrostis curvula TaxID=38414 RepID=A0A5J9VMJ5_9POAL|nr:hypothetical protein EJB05_18960 [Eragrostis curvula]